MSSTSSSWMPTSITTLIAPIYTVDTYLLNLTPEDPPIIGGLFEEQTTKELYYDEESPIRPDFTPHPEFVKTPFREEDSTDTESSMDGGYLTDKEEDSIDTESSVGEGYLAIAEEALTDQQRYPIRQRRHYQKYQSLEDEKKGLPSLKYPILTRSRMQIVETESEDTESEIDTESEVDTKSVVDNEEEYNPLELIKKQKQKIDHLIKKKELLSIRYVRMKAYEEGLRKQKLSFTTTVVERLKGKSIEVFSKREVINNRTPRKIKQQEQQKQLKSLKNMIEVLFGLIKEQRKINQKLTEELNIQ